MIQNPDHYFQLLSVSLSLLLDKNLFTKNFRALFSRGLISSWISGLDCKFFFVPIKELCFLQPLSGWLRPFLFFNVLGTTVNLSLLPSNPYEDRKLDSHSCKVMSEIKIKIFEESLSCPSKVWTVSQLICLLKIDFLNNWVPCFLVPSVTYLNLSFPDLTLFSSSSFCWWGRGTYTLGLCGWLNTQHLTPDRWDELQFINYIYSTAQERGTPRTMWGHLDVALGNRVNKQRPWNASFVVSWGWSDS